MAPGTTLPAGSVNVPAMVPAPLFCAKTALAKSAIVNIQIPAKYTKSLSLDTGFMLTPLTPLLNEAQD